MTRSLLKKVKKRKNLQKLTANIGNAQQRIGWRLQPHKLRILTQRIAHILRASRVDHGELNAVLWGALVQVAVGAAVEVVASDGMIAILRLIIRLK